MSYLDHYTNTVAGAARWERDHYIDDMPAVDYDPADDDLYRSDRSDSTE
jgi:hypothetical protein